MMIDDNLFCGSMNIGKFYTNKYGCAEFRDLSISLEKQNIENTKKFFIDIIKTNDHQLTGITMKDLEDRIN